MIFPGIQLSHPFHCKAGQMSKGQGQDEAMAGDREEEVAGSLSEKLLIKLHQDKPQYCNS